jgi:cyclopropane fatty-acyl-phospholipid synthase-like methyltransferase
VQSSPPDPTPGSGAARWDAGYQQGQQPWDIGRAQPAFIRLVEAGEVVGPVLDCGCGTGENALMIAARGLETVGIDIAPTAIRAAQRKAAERGLNCDFLVADALDLSSLGRRFATIIDSGLFHTFSDEDRPRYVTSLADVVEPGGVIYLMCFSELTPGQDGPRRVTQGELHGAFSDGWTMERIEHARFEVTGEFDFGPMPHAWLARIVRR